MRLYALFLVVAIPTLFPASAPAAEPVRVGVCLSLSGEYAASGRKALAGVKLRVDDYNANAGPDDFRVALVIRDDKSEAETAAKVVDDLSRIQGVEVVIGGLSTNIVLEMRKVAAERKVVVVTPTATSPLLGRNGDWVFRLLFDDEFQGVALARYLYRATGARTAAAIVNSRLSYAQSVNQAFKRVFEEEGGAVVGEEFYEWVDNEDAPFDFRPALRRMRETKPDFILLPNTSVGIGMIIRQSLAEGVTSRFCGGDTWLNESILSTAGNNLEGAIYVTGINYESRTREMEHYLGLYDYSNDPDIQMSSVLGYDAASLVIEALRSGSDAESIRRALYALKNFPLATGAITIDPGRGSEKTAYINKIEKIDGEFAAVVAGEIRP